MNTGTTGILLEDAQGNPIKAAGMVTAVIDVEQGQDCWTAPSISENFIVSDSTNILLSMGRILTNGWKLEYNPEIPEGEQTLSAQYNISVSSMVLVSPDGKATPRIFYKRNSCCLLGRISVVGNGRTHVPEGTRWTGTGRRWTETGQGYGNARSSTDSRTAVAKLLLGGVGQNSEWQMDDHGRRNPFHCVQRNNFCGSEGCFSRMEVQDNHDW